MDAVMIDEKGLEAALEYAFYMENGPTKDGVKNILYAYEAAKEAGQPDDCAKEIISALDDYARDVDMYELGLPVHGDEHPEKMEAIVNKILDSTKRESGWQPIE